MTLTAPDSYLLSPYPIRDPTPALRIAADILVTTPARAGVALRYRIDKDTHQRSFYACWIDGQGQYGCFQALNDTWSSFAEATPHEAIRPGRANRVTLTMDQTNVAFYVNGVKVHEFKDTQITQGGAALYVENFDDPAAATFDTVAVTLPPLPH